MQRDERKFVPFAFDIWLIMKRILGLDASTTTIGLCVIDFDGYGKTLVHHEYFKPPKKGDIFERLATVRDFIFERLDEYKPDHVCLEDIILFMKGHSTAKTINSLAVLNRTVGLAVFNHSGRAPTLLNVMKIRHALKLDKKLPTKEEIPDLVAFHLNLGEFPWRLNKKEKVMEENYDMADAMAVALTFIKISAVELKPKKTSKKKRLTK